MNTVYLLSGSNEGDRVQWLRQCMSKLESNVGRVISVSHLYETAAWGIEDQPDFLNMAICLETRLSPQELLTVIQQIEQYLGRQRAVKWGQRTLDIDILFFNSEIIDEPGLKIPHPYLHERRFALKPLAEIAGDFIHPGFNKTIATLLDACPDPLSVKKTGQI